MIRDTHLDFHRIFLCCTPHINNILFRTWSLPKPSFWTELTSHPIKNLSQYVTGADPEIVQRRGGEEEKFERKMFVDIRINACTHKN